MKQKHLKSRLKYCPTSGHFTWLNGNRQGKRAGSVRQHDYRAINMNGVLYYEHRLAFLYMTGAFPKNKVDHINREKADNRWKNLREASNYTNAQNVSVHRDSKTGVRGVHIHTKSQKYAVQLMAKGKRYSFGLYSDLEWAELVAEEAREKFYCESKTRRERDGS